MRKALFFSVWLSCTFFINGCVAVYPQDIAVTSISVVDYRDQAEFPAPAMNGSSWPTDPYRDFLFALSEKKGKTLISPSDIDVYFQQQKRNESFKRAKPQVPIFKLTFTSKENLHEFARDKGYPVASTPFFCGQPDTPVILGHSSIYWRGLLVSAPLGYVVERNDDELLVYYTFLNVAFSAKAPSSFESFDLRTHPEDICFQLKGGFAGRGFESNVVVIPKAEIIKALEQMPAELRESPAL